MPGDWGRMLVGDIRTRRPCTRPWLRRSCRGASGARWNRSTRSPPMKWRARWNACSAEFEQQLFRQADQAANPGLQQSLFRHPAPGAPEPRRPDPALPQRPGSRPGRHPRPDRPPTPGKITGRAAFRRPAPGRGPRTGRGERAARDRLPPRARAPACRLHLLGQRFGVLAGAPAFEAERLPVGPQQLGTHPRARPAASCRSSCNRGWSCSAASTITP